MFEVDHLAIPSSMTFAPVDFERQTLAEGLALAGLDPHAPALFSWLGVTMYLSDEALSSTLRFIASRPADSGVVFDYAVARQSLGWIERLTDDGFTAIDDLAADDLNAQYFSNRADGLHISGGLGRLVIAWR